MIHRIIIVLTPAQLAYCLRRGRRRRAAAGGARLHQRPLDAGVDGPNDHDPFEGTLGEFAFSLYSGLPIQRDETGGRGDGGYDFIMPNGETLDVKYTKYSTGRFLPRYDEGLLADLGVLANRVGDNHRIELAGWLTLEEWHRDKQQEQFSERIGVQDFYPRDLMTGMPELVERTGIILPAERWQQIA